MRAHERGERERRGTARSKLLQRGVRGAIVNVWALMMGR